MDYPADPGCSSPTDTDELDAGCHPSYPDFCIQPPPPDLNCDYVAPRSRFTVRHDVVDPDPHGFDSDQGGEGCETEPVTDPVGYVISSSTSAATASLGETSTLA
jgi:hypothetical protein